MPSLSCEGSPDRDFRRAFLCNRDGQQGQAVLVPAGDLLRLRGSPRRHDEIERFLLAVDKQEVVALLELGLQVMAFTTVQLDVDARFQLDDDVLPHGPHGPRGLRKLLIQRLLIEDLRPALLS